MTYQTGVQVITSPSQLAAANLITVDTGGPDFVVVPLSILQEFLAGTEQGPQFDFGTNAAAASTVLTAANISGGAIENDLALTGALAAAATATLPTAAALVAALPNAFVGQTYKLRIINESSGAFAWTIAAGAGFTLGGSGNYTIAQNTFRDFIVTITGIGAAAAATLQDIGGNGATE